MIMVIAAETLAHSYKLKSILYITLSQYDKKQTNKQKKN